MSDTKLYRNILYQGCMVELFMNDERKGYARAYKTLFDDVAEFFPWRTEVGGAEIFFNEDGQVAGDLEREVTVKKKILESKEMYDFYCNSCEMLAPTASDREVIRALRKRMTDAGKSRKLREKRHFNVQMMLDQHSLFAQEWAM